MKIGAKNRIMVELKQVVKKYQTEDIETTALHNINLSVKKGEFVSIMGPSGCGKSTLLNVIGLLDKPSAGEVFFADNLTSKMSAKELAKFRNQNLGFIFQSFHLINDLKVIDNVELPLIYRKMSGKERRRLAEEALIKVGLGNRMNHYPSQLSGGQRQRVAIARAIVGQPKLILADEPTGNLDSKNGQDVMQLLLDMNHQNETTIIMVTHDEAMAKQTERLIRLYDGAQVH